MGQDDKTGDTLFYPLNTPKQSKAISHQHLSLLFRHRFSGTTQHMHEYHVIKFLGLFRHQQLLANAKCSLKKKEKRSKCQMETCISVFQIMGFFSHLLIQNISSYLLWQGSSCVSFSLISILFWDIGFRGFQPVHQFGALYTKLWITR